MNNRKRIMVAAPIEDYPGCPINVTLETLNFFAQDENVEVWSSTNPAEVEKADAVIVPGGLPDVSPAYWGEENVGCHVVDEPLDKLQMELIDRAFKLHKPILGICRGMQMITVYLGGTLIQDIECGIFHIYEPGDPRFHDIYNVPGTPLYEAYGPVIHGNSGHHQAVKKLPECLKVAQLWAPDVETAAKYLKLAEENKIREGSEECIIEAVVHTDYPFLGLQWHPELVGDLFCKAVDLVRIRQCFYDMIQAEQDKH